MKSLIIGMGIGQLYKSVLTELGHDVITVDQDPAKHADFYDYSIAFSSHNTFDTVHICTPNFTHLNIARNCAAWGAKLIFIEKPGVENHKLLEAMIKDFPNTRFLMVKNNQFRNEIKHFTELAAQSEEVYIRWNNNNRIPSPGSWFTNKELAFGGVSRDLIPHMLSYYCVFTNYANGVKLYAKAEQRWALDQIDSTEYGIINKAGVYNVDDFCELEFTNGNTRYILSANWRSLDKTDISISFNMKDRAVRHELGLCPELAYKKMICEAIENLNNDAYWIKQQDQDLWIHKQIENL
jgi:predicted dehydrogenase